MIDKLLRFSLGNRAIVLAIAVALLAVGGFTATRLPVDVFPDINRPMVTLMTEAPGLAAEEVETLVTIPLETALNGSTGVDRIRSASATGLSIVWIEFPWGSDVYRDRQIVAEKVQLARERLPTGANPTLAPISSLMGEIQLIGIHSRTGATSPLELRSLADWVVRPRLLSLPGVSQVTVLGGAPKQVHVLADPAKLALYDVTLEDLVRSCKESSASLGGGFVLDSSTERLVRVMGRIESLDDVRGAIVLPRQSAGGADESNAPLITTPVLVRDVASVDFGRPVARGDGSVNAAPAVILSVQKQPGADTIALTREVDRALAGIEPSLPGDVGIDRDVFRQSDFIETAVTNLGEALRDGAILAAIVLFLFLWNGRTTLISLVAIPAALLLAALVFHVAGIGINTMTLGGLAVAVGELVDDSIVDVENVFRRLRENRARGEPRPALAVVYDASREIRHSIVHATVVIALVFLPLFSLSGLEGRLFTPLGIAYLVALFASLLVSLTVTPVLCSLLLPRAQTIERREDAFLLRWLKAADRRLLQATLRHPGAILLGASLVVVGSTLLLFRLGTEFLPPFAEGTYTVSMIAAPGTSLEESNRLGTLAEKTLLSIPGVASTSRRTGRAELDEHAEGVNYSEIDVRLEKSSSTDRERVAREIRERLAYVPGVLLNVGQPIAHRLDHILSGTRAQVAIKVFGEDLAVLRDRALAIHDAIRDVSGVVDAHVEAQEDVPQVRVRMKREELARFGLTVEHVGNVVETALEGKVASQILDGRQSLDLVVWYPPEARSDLDTIRNTLLDAPIGGRVALRQVADVIETSGPSTVERENAQRRIVISMNVSGRDLGSVIADIRPRVAGVALPAGYFIEYGGQFESRVEAFRRILLLGAVAVVGIFLVLRKALDSSVAALQCMANVPLAAAGGALALWLTSGTISLAALVGFITLAGIATRNGILMISHYRYLLEHEGRPFDADTIVRGSLERLAPVLMTALTAAFGLLPLALGSGATGKEIQHPLAVVILGGLVFSTILDQVVTPALFFKLGKRVYASGGRTRGDEIE